MVLQGKPTPKHAKYSRWLITIPIPATGKVQQ